MFATILLVLVALLLLAAWRFDRRHGLRVGTGGRRGAAVDATYGARATVYGEVTPSYGPSGGSDGDMSGGSGASSC
jgi:hypothetical protein